jgi:PAS domain S-box-containing protein
MPKHLLLILCFFIWVMPVHAEENHIRFDRLSLADGLPHTSVYAILQDRQGFMWFSTDDGVCRYDGYTFTTFKPVPGNPESISQGAGYSLYEDRSGTIWIGTRNGGLNKYDPVRGTFAGYRHEPDNPNSLSHDCLAYDGIYEDSAGNLWIGTWDGLNRFDPVRETFVRYQHDPANPNSLTKGFIRVLRPDPADDRILWIGTDEGLNRFDRHREKFVRYEHDENKPGSISHNTVWAIYAEVSEEGKPILWVGTSGGLDRFEPETETFTHFRHDPESPNSLSNNEVYSVLSAGDKRLWVGTHGGGLNLFDLSNKTFAAYRTSENPQTVSSNIIHPLYYDRTGTLWIGTWGGGLSRIDPLNQKTRLYDRGSGLSASSVLSLYEDSRGKVWLGTWGGGLNRFDPETGRFENFRHDPNNPASLGSDVAGCLYEDAYGVLWVGTWGGGLNKFDRETGQFKRYVWQPDNPKSLSHNSVRAICEDAAGSLWVGTTSGGMNRFERDTETFARYLYDPENPYSISTNNIWSAIKDSSGTLWITSTAGLNRLDPSTERFVHYHYDENDPASISSDAAISIYEDARKRLWITTQFGLNQFEKSTGQFVRYFESDGLPDNRIESICEDNDGNLWLGTGKGLCRFTPETKKFATYGIGDGMQSNLFFYPAAMKSSTGELWFGGPKGVNVIDPKKFTDNPHTPPVVLTDFQTDGKSVLPGADSVLKQHISSAREIILPPDISKFGFEFAALNYTVSAKNQYAYKMEGFDKDWIHTGSDRRFASYTNLDPGIYIFRVKASNNDGVWNEDGTFVKIIVLPPWWKTWRVRISLTFLFAVLLFAGYRWRISAVESRNRILEEEVAERTLSLTREIAERRRAEEILRRSETLLNETGRMANVGGWEFDTETREQVWTREVYRIHEVDPDYRPTVEKGIEFYAPESRPVIENAVRRAVDYGESFDLKLQFVTAKGNRRWVHCMGSAERVRGKTVKVSGTFQDITEIMQVQEELLKVNKHLQEREALFHGMFERHSAVMLLVHPHTGRIIEANQAALKYYGYTLAELEENGGIYEINQLPPEEIRQEMSRAITERCNCFEFRHRLANGDIRDVEVHSAPISRQGETVLFSVIHDITARKKAEEALQRSEELFRQAFENANVGICLVGTDGKLLKVNRRMCDMFGYESHEMENMTVNDLAHPDFSEVSPRFIRHALEGNIIKDEFEKKYINRRKNFVWAQVSSSLIRDGEGNPLYFISHVMDITERKQAEERLREKEQLLSDIINFLPDATLVIDSRGSVLAWNRAMEDMTGIPANDMLGKGDYAYAAPFYGEHRPILIDLALQPSQNIEKKYPQIQRYGDTMTAENYFPDLRGKETWLVGKASVLRDSEGQIVGAIESVRDITDRKLAETELKKAKEAAQAAERVKNTFLANVSHHLRTPLNSVLGFSEIMAEDKSLSKQYQEYIAMIRRSGKDLLAIINQMLEVSKLNPDSLSSDPRYQHLLNLLEKASLQAGPDDEQDFSTLDAGAADQIRKLPPEMSAPLTDAVKSLDIRQILDIIRQIRPEYPDAANALEYLANRFEYETILSFIENGNG